MSELLPCPFCAIKLKHVISLARSFDPPREYHEYQHAYKDNCPFRRQTWAFNDNQKAREEFDAEWNTRAALAAPEAEAVREACADKIVAAIWADISDRRGLRQELDQIDDAIKDEIKAEWRAKAIRALDLAKVGK